MQRKKGLAPNDPLLRDAMAAQSKAFSARFGRAPTAHDPIFFCWHSDMPRAMCELCFAEYERAIVAAAEKAGIDPARALEIAGVDDPLGSLKTTH
jgi:hypothetical protein